MYLRPLSLYFYSVVLAQPLRNVKYCTIKPACVTGSCLALLVR